MRHVVFLALVLGLPQLAHANSKGIAGYSGMNATYCTACHKSAAAAKAVFSGPSFLKPGAKGTFTFTVYGYTLNPGVGGLDVAASGGALSVNANETSSTKLLNKELVHSSPKKPSSGFTFSWQLDWTAPTVPGTYALYGAGLSANGDATSAGDASGTAKHSVAVGSCSSNADCQDNDVCTTDYCDPLSKQCVNNPINNCCNTPADCDDKNPCTQNLCGNNHQCQYPPILACCTSDNQCNDMNPCTSDYCDQATNKCAHAKDTSCCTFTIPCNDGNKCTKDECNYATNQCTFYPMPNCCKQDADCTDGNPCTNDTCNVGTGICLNSPVTGCCQVPADCDDNNPCTQELCTNNKCVNNPIAGCCQQNTDCDDGNPCTTDTCVKAKCSHQPVAGCVPPDAGPPPGDGPLPAADGPVPWIDAQPPTGDGPAVSADSGMPLPDSGATADSGTAPPSDDDGCCRVGGEPGHGGPLSLLLLVGLLLALRLKRR